MGESGESRHEAVEMWGLGLCAAGYMAWVSNFQTLQSFGSLSVKCELSEMVKDAWFVKRGTVRMFQGSPRQGRQKCFASRILLFLVLLSWPNHFLSCTVTKKSLVGNTPKEMSTAWGPLRYLFMVLGRNSRFECLTELQVWVICSVECVHSLLFPVILDALGILLGTLDTSKADPRSKWPSMRCPITEMVS